MFKMTKLQHPALSLSVAGAIVAATLAAGCGATDSPTAPETITDTVIVAAALTAGCGATDFPTAPETITASGLVSLGEVVAYPCRRMEFFIPSFEFDGIEMLEVRRVGKRKLRTRFRASAVVSVECGGDPDCEAAIGETARLAFIQFTDVDGEAVGPDDLSQHGIIRGRILVLLSPDGNMDPREFRGQVRGLFLCGEGVCNAETQVEAQAQGGGKLSGRLQWTFTLSLQDIVINKIASSGFTFERVPVVIPSQFP